jgi:hypothetical protein
LIKLIETVKSDGIIMQMVKMMNTNDVLAKTQPASSRSYKRVFVSKM